MSGQTGYPTNSVSGVTLSKIFIEGFFLGPKRPSMNVFVHQALSYIYYLIC